MSINITVTLTAPSNVITITSTQAPQSYVNADEEFRFDGITGNSYLKYNSSTSKVELYVDGVKKATWG